MKLRNSPAQCPRVLLLGEITQNTHTNKKGVVYFLVNSCFFGTFAVLFCKVKSHDNSALASSGKLLQLVFYFLHIFVERGVDNIFPAPSLIFILQSRVSFHFDTNKIKFQAIIFLINLNLNFFMIYRDIVISRVKLFRLEPLIIKMVFNTSPSYFHQKPLSLFKGLLMTKLTLGQSMMFYARISKE